MNSQELRDALRQERIRDDAYDLDGGHLPETAEQAEKRSYCTSVNRCPRIES
jgi:hypothetical protein